MPADAPRLVSTGEDTGVVVVAAAPAGTRVHPVDESLGTPSGTIPDEHKQQLPWTA